MNTWCHFLQGRCICSALALEYYLTPATWTFNQTLNVPHVDIVFEIHMVFRLQMIPNKKINNSKKTMRSQAAISQQCALNPTSPWPPNLTIKTNKPNQQHFLNIYAGRLLVGGQMAARWHVHELGRRSPIYIHIHINLHIYTHAYEYIYIYICMDVCASVCMYTYVY